MTGNRAARVLVGLFFVALLTAPVVMKRISAGRDADRSRIDAKTERANVTAIIIRVTPILIGATSFNSIFTPINPSIKANP